MAKKRILDEKVTKKDEQELIKLLKGKLREIKFIIKKLSPLNSRVKTVANEIGEYNEYADTKLLGSYGILDVKIYKFSKDTQIAMYINQEEFSLTEDLNKLERVIAYPLSTALSLEKRYTELLKRLES